MRRIYIDVGGQTCPQKGSKSFLEALVKAVRRSRLSGEVEVIPRGCFGLCNIAPNLYIEPDGIWYSKFTEKDIPIIIRQHLKQGKPVTRLIRYPDPRVAKRMKGGHFAVETLIAKEIQVGETAPDFALKDQNGQDVVLSSFRGKKNAVLAFYPFDWSPVCTTENCALTEDLSQFDNKETVILGISCDSHFSHKAWGEKLNLKHTLLSDLKREVCKKYGLFFEDMNCSKRATILVDRLGKVTYKKVQEIKVPRANQEILAAIR